MYKYSWNIYPHVYVTFIFHNNDTSEEIFPGKGMIHVTYGIIVQRLVHYVLNKPLDTQHSLNTCIGSATGLLRFISTTVASKSIQSHCCWQTIAIMLKWWCVLSHGKYRYWMDVVYNEYSLGIYSTSCSKDYSTDQRLSLHGQGLMPSCIMTLSQLQAI